MISKPSEGISSRQVSDKGIIGWLALCGIAAGALDLLIPLGVGWFNPEYSHVRQYISELGVPGQPFGSLISAWFIIYGLLLTGFSLGLFCGLPRNGPAKIGGLLLIISGLFNGVGSGLFPCDPGCWGESFSGQMHNALAAIGVSALAVTPFFIWVAMRNDHRWQGYGLFTMAIQAVGLIVFILFVRADNTRNSGVAESWVGALQRLFYTIYYLWVIVIALKLVRLSRIRR